jgi:hypothetical protein
MFIIEHQNRHMKKISLTISEPCSENWDQMSANEKGRFCSNCQKTVIDFREMSDRKLAEFFKKPPGMVCGRFFLDQLERPIPIPQKRIPWLRYFFTISWPAFILLLKSCGQKSVMGNISPAIETSAKKLELQGDIVAYPADTIAIQKKDPVENKIPQIQNRDEKSQPVPLIQQPLTQGLSDTIPVVESLPMDTVTIIHYPQISKSVIMGGISTRIPKCQIEKDSVIELKKSDPGPGFIVYPNPASAGSLVTISLDEGMNMPEKVEIFSGAGQLMASIRQNPSELATVFNITIPASTTPGIYFIRLTRKDWRKPFTQKILVRGGK